MCFARMVMCRVHRRNGAGKTAVRPTERSSHLNKISENELGVAQQCARGAIVQTRLSAVSAAQYSQAALFAHDLALLGQLGA